MKLEISHKTFARPTISKITKFNFYDSSTYTVFGKMFDYVDSAYLSCSDFDSLSTITEVVSLSTWSDDYPSFSATNINFNAINHYMIEITLPKFITPTNVCVILSNEAGYYKSNVVPLILSQN